MSETPSKLQKTQQDFKNFYDTQLREEYAKLELSRQKYLKMFWRNLIILILFLIFTSFIYKNHLLMMTLSKIKGDLLIYLWGGLLAFIVVFCIAPFVLYERETKSATMEKILSFWGNFKYSNVHTISEENLEKSKIFNFLGSGNPITIGDAFEGEYNQTKICIDEKQIRTSKNGFYLFDGVMIMLQFNKNFPGNVLVKNHKNIVPTIKHYLVILFYVAIYMFLCISFFLQIFIFNDVTVTQRIISGIALCIALCLLFYTGKQKSADKQKKLQSVTLEDVFFNKEWTVTTDNQVDARRFLTPVFMEKINDIKRLFHGKSIDFSLFENKLIMAIHTHKDLFETSALFTPALSYKKVSEVIGQLYSIFAVIDIIKKNTNFMTAKKQTEKKKYMIKNLYVFRHGETDLNREGRFQGQSNNPPLNADGLEQAKNLAAQFADIKLDVVYTSPLNRAYQTGAMVAQSKKVPLIVDERLIEGNFGIAEGMLKTDIQKQFAEEYKKWRDFKDMDYAFEGGESKLQILERVLDFIAFLEKEPYQNIGISAHSAVIRSLLIHLGIYQDKIPNAEIIQLTLENGKVYKKQSPIK